MASLRVRQASPVDGIERLYAFKRVGEGPLVVVAGKAVSTLLAGWWQQLWIRGGIWLLVLLLGAVALRHYLRRLGFEASLRIAATAFEGQQGMMITDAGGRILRVNAAFSRITGYAEPEVVGHTPSLLASGRHDHAFYRQMWQAIEQVGSWEGEVWNRRRDGEVYPERLTISAVRDGQGSVTHYIGAFSDISQLKAAEQKARQLAYFDPMTGLPNRRALLEQLAGLADGTRAPEPYAALLLIDLDHFRQVNELVGHAEGDRLLTRLPGELRQHLREEDGFARLAGDEFGVLLQGLGPDQEHAAYLVERIATRLLGAIQLSLPGHQPAQRVTASIGIAMFRNYQAGDEEVLNQAEMALQQAKQGGRNRFCFFDPLLQSQQHEHMRLEADLRHALSADQFRLHYQPQVNDDGTILGAEVLMRWEHPDRGMVSPGVFIPLAEANGLIVAIDHWMLHKACEQLARWARHDETRGLTLAVNISAQQFHQDDFVALVRQTLLATGAPPARLKLEVTEGLFMERQAEARQRMLALKALGIRFALDDFGTGFSSLSYLHQLPLDQLKIDQSFVRHLLADSASGAIVASIIGLAASLGIEVIAEWVESEAQRAWLKSHGCDLYQGYLFGRPEPVEALEARLRVEQGLER